MDLAKTPDKQAQAVRAVRIALYVLHKVNEAAETTGINPLPVESLADSTEDSLVESTSDDTEEDSAKRIEDKTESVLQQLQALQETTVKLAKAREINLSKPRFGS